MHTTRTLLRGIAALIGVALILLGIPAALWALGGSPIPIHLPDLAALASFLMRPDDGTLFIGALKLVGWAGWLSYALPLVVELVCRLAHVRAPRMPRIMRTQQRQVAALAAAIAMLAAGTNAASAATPPSTTATADAGGAPAQPTQSRTTAPTQKASAQEQTVTVKPGDTLWQIADRTLGEGEAWPTIAKATAQHIQPDGRRLSNPDLIYPGWILTVPATNKAHNPAPTPTTEHDQATTSGADNDQHDTPAATQAPTQQASPTTLAGSSSRQGGETAPTGTATTAPTETPTEARTKPGIINPTGAPTAPSTTAPTAAPTTPAPAPPAEPAPTTAPAEPAAPATPDTPETASSAPAAMSAQESATDVVATVAGLGALAAAGLLATLAMRRRRQERLRTTGQRIPLPTGKGAVAEAQMRAAADPVGVDVLDRALRTLAANAHATDTPLPRLRAARLSPTDIELYLVDHHDTLPPPFEAVATDPGSWALPRAHHDTALMTTRELEHVANPWPTLVSIGTETDGHHGHILLHLEELGSLGLTGDPENCHAVLTALAIELITAATDGQARITLVGLLPELAHALGTDTVTYCDDVDEAYDALTYAADIHREHLRDTGHPDISNGRLHDATDEAWTPHLILVSTYLDHHDHNRLRDLVATIPRTALAAITSGGEPLGEWWMSVRSDNEGQLTGVIAPVGLQVTPQYLSLADYDAYMEPFRATDQPLIETEAAASSTLDVTALPEPRIHEIGEAVQVETSSTELTPVAPVDTEDTEQTEQRIEAASNDLPTDSAPDLEEAPGEATDEAPTAQDAAAPAEATEAVEAAEVHPTPSGSTLAPEAPTDAAPAESAESDLFPGNSDEDLVPIVTAIASPTDASAQSDVPEVEDALSTVARVDAPMLRLLGPVEIRGERGTKPRAHGRALEVLAFLALHPSDSPQPLTEAIFPGERPRGTALGEKRNKYVGLARRWLGSDPEGQPHLPLVSQGGYRLRGVHVDWSFFSDLAGAPGTAETSSLHTALGMVDGRPLSGIDDSRWAWAQADIAEMIAAVADVAHELAVRSLQAGDVHTAVWAAEKGLAAEPVSEMLWRDRITAAWQLGDLDAIIARYHGLLDDLTVDPAPETLDLIHQITQRRRDTVPAHA